ncbi:MAG: hypothetical protein ACK41T_10990 [Pseudobdellovibrio sp.]
MDFNSFDDIISQLILRVILSEDKKAVFFAACFIIFESSSVHLDIAITIRTPASALC